MARAGVVAVIVPSFWLGQPRTNLGSYVDYFSTILGFTLRTMNVLAEHGFEPGRCIIEHNTEETVRQVLDRGCFVGFSIYPQTWGTSA